MFEAARVFASAGSGGSEKGWYFESREGVWGPYETERLAAEALRRHIEYCRQFRLDGGREVGVESGGLKLEQR